MFGAEEGREYFEWVTEHRMASMERRRIYADGEAMPLDVPHDAYIIPADATPADEAKLEAAYLERNRRIYAELSERGLLPPEGEDLLANEMNEHLRSGRHDETEVPPPGNADAD